MSEVLWLIAVAMAVWFWIDTLNTRERAVSLCRETCRARGLQLLDQTVALDRMTPARDKMGRLRWRRRYRFEFTEDGSGRSGGTIVMLGTVLVALEMEHQGSRIYEHGEF